MSQKYKTSCGILFVFPWTDVWGEERIHSSGSTYAVGEDACHQRLCWRIYCSWSLKRHWVTHCLALLQGVWAMVQQSCRPALRPSQGRRGVPHLLEIGVELSLLLFTLWLIVELFRSHRCTIQPTCRHLSHSIPTTLSSVGLHCGTCRAKNHREAHHTKLWWW